MAAVSNDLGKELLGLEKQYWQAMKDRDADTAMRLSDDPCVVTGAQGVGSMTRKSVPAMIKDAKWTLKSFRIGDNVQVRKLSEDVAILAYQVHEDLIVDGKPIAIDAADASTWVRRDGQWLCALHTESLIGDPFGRDRHA
jgi:Domain of unknown function (DUF4440)